MDSEDLELDGDTAVRSKTAQGVTRKNISIKLKSKPRGRARKTSTRGTRKKKEDVVAEIEEKPPAVDLDDQMPSEEAIEEFSTMKVTGEEPIHQSQKLMWKHKVNLIGMKVVDPIIHSCSTCLLPILIYGRMIPCKHVFCFDCAKKTDKVCPRCSDPVNRVEQSALGAVFVCNYGGNKHGVTGCRRTYLSQRDLQAHVNYRHLKEQSDHGSSKPGATSQPPPAVLSPASAGPQLPPPPQTSYSTGVGVSGAALLSPGLTMMQQPPPQQSHDLGLGGLQQRDSYHQQGAMPQQHRGLENLGHQHSVPPPPVQTHAAQPPQHTGPPLQHTCLPPQQQPMHPGLPPPPPVGTGPGLHTQGPPPAQGLLQPTGSSAVDYHNIPVMSSRISNLITVPIQDEREYGRCHDPSQPGYVPGAKPVVSQNFHHPPPSQAMMSCPPPLQQYSSVSQQQPQLNSPHMSHQGGMFNSNTRPLPPQAMNHPPPPMSAPRPMNMSMNQPLPSNTLPPPMQGVPPSNTHGAPQLQGPPPQGPPPQGPPLQGPPPQGPPPQGPPPQGAPRFPNTSLPPPPRTQNPFSQPPPMNQRTWPNPQGPMGGPPPQGPPPQGPPPQGPPPPRHQNNSNNMGPPPQRPFYQ